MLNGLTTVTDTAGQYSFAFVQLGAVAVSVREDATRGQGSASTTLTQQGVTKTVDVTLLPQGALVVTVRDANGNLVPSAAVTISANFGAAHDNLAGTTGADGVVVIDHVLAGTFTVQAKYGGLAGNGNGTLAAGEQKV
jgi:hypothetical protein